MPTPQYGERESDARYGLARRSDALTVTPARAVYAAVRHHAVFSRRAFSSSSYSLVTHRRDGPAGSS